MTYYPEVCQQLIYDLGEIYICRSSWLLAIGSCAIYAFHIIIFLKLFQFDSKCASTDRDIYHVDKQPTPFHSRTVMEATIFYFFKRA